jgi:preprotein translocase subunit SecB
MIDKDDELYKEFLNNLHLNNIEVVELSSKKDEEFNPPAEIKILIKNDFIPEEHKLKIYSDFKLNAESNIKKEKFSLNINIKFLLKYEMKFIAGKDVYKIYENTYLPLITYPYFRYFIQEITLKMGLAPLTLDLIKINIDNKNVTRSKKKTKK